MVLTSRARGGVAVGFAAALLLVSLAPGASAKPVSASCRAGTSFESRTLDGLTVMGGRAKVQRRVRLEGCHALRLSPGRTIVGREVPGGPPVNVTFAYRSQRRVARPLLALKDNAIRLTDDGHGRVVVYRGDRRLVRVARRGGRRWGRVRVTLRTGRLAIRVDGRSAYIRNSGLGSARSVLFGGRARRRAGALFLDALSVSASPPVATPIQPAPALPNAAALRVFTGIFAPDSFWNAALVTDAPLDPRSGALVAELRRQLGLGAPWINTTEYSTPVYQVPAHQPTVRVALDIAHAPLQQAWEAVPVPSDARPAGGTDKHMVVWQPATDTMWEFWQMQRDASGWHARWGGRITGLSRSPGYYTGAERNWGASATSMPLLGGLITLDDLRRGRIDHALGIAIPEARRNWWTWPAQRTDGKKDDPAAIPEGARFRLNPTLDLNRLNLYPLVRMMAEAAQRYGIVVRDQSGVVSFAGEDPTPTGTNPWEGPNGAFSGQYPSTLMQQFPWQHLQALRTNQECCGSR